MIAPSLLPMSDLTLEPLAGYNATKGSDGFFYDFEKAQRAADFFPQVLTHVKQSRYTRARQPFVLEPWQDELVRLIFGVVDGDGLRRYRTVYLEVPRKNGKTTLAAGLALYGLVADGEDGAECYCAAADRDQATLLFDVVVGMINQTELLSAEPLCKVRQSVKRVIYKNSYLKAISSDAHTKHGFNSHMIVCDELHAWKGRDLWDVLRTSTGARAQPLTIAITTAGHDKQSVCWEIHEYAEKVRDGKIDDPQFLPVLYTSEHNDDWKDPKVWEKANPNFGVSLAKEYMEAACKEATANPAYQNTFRRLHLNQWTSQATRWIDMDAWRKCGEYGHSKGLLVPWTEGQVVGGLDLSSTTDISAWCMVQRCENDQVRMNWRYYLPNETAERAEKTDGVPYRQWAEEGLLTLTNGNRIDYAKIEADILRDCDDYGIQSIGFDPWNADYMVQNLEREGLDMVSVRQGYASLSQPCKQFEAMIAAQELLHGGNPVTEWQADNVEVQTDVNGNIRPIKPQHAASGKRIDGIVAAIVALAVALAHEPPPVLDYYENHGLEMI